MRKVLPFVVLALTIGCSSTRVAMHSRPSDLELVMGAASTCADSIAHRSTVMPRTIPVSIEMTGNEEETWLVKSLIEGSLLNGGFTLVEKSITDDSLTQTIEVKVLDLGVHHRAVDRKGLTRKPWILREGVCVLVIRGVDADGDVLFSGESIGKKADWTPASTLERLSDPLFTPDLGGVPTSSGIIGPLAVVAAAGGLMALFFITSD